MDAERNVWRYRAGLEISSDLRGFSVATADSAIGKVDECSTAVGGTYIVVETHPWIGCRRAMLPGGLIERIDYERETVVLKCERADIENAPEFDGSTYRHDSYRTELGDYYDATTAKHA